jgi:hypothetical protein
MISDHIADRRKPFSVELTMDTLVSGKLVSGENEGLGKRQPKEEKAILICLHVTSYFLLSAKHCCTCLLCSNSHKLS